jgi:hypothetical protein
LSLKPGAFPVRYPPKILSMKDPLIVTCFITALILTAMLCGASWDQSVKQLPARRIIGVTAFSAYAKAADLTKGVIWYAILGMGAALTSLVMVVVAWKFLSHESVAFPLYLAGFFALCHSVCTSQAAPLYHKQKRISNEAELEKLFHKFEKIQTLRSIFISLNLLCFIWSLTLVIT